MKIISADIGLADAFSAAHPDFGVVVEGNRIVAAGNRQALITTYSQAEVEHFNDAVLLPAFVNSHDHGRGLGTASLGIEDDILEKWLIGLWSQPVIDPYLAAAYDGVRLLRSGVTLTAHSHNPRAWGAQQSEGDATIRGYRDAGIRVAFHPVIVDQNRLIYAASPEEESAYIDALPADQQSAAREMARPPISHDDYFAQCDALYAAHHAATDHTVHVQVSPAGGQWCSDELIVRSVDWAKTHTTRVQMHMLETHRQRDYAFRKWSKSFIRHLDDIGALGPWLTLAHMVWVEPDDLPLLAERGVSIAHNPSSNLRLRSGIAPLSEMLQAGVTVGIGLDGHALDDDQDYLREMRLAWTLANMRANQPRPSASPVDAALVLHAGTAGGAATTFGTAVSLGRLVAGALADLVVINTRFAALDLSLRLKHLSADVLHLATREHVRHVMCNGDWVVRGGCSVRLDEAALLHAIRAAVRSQH
jgi:cytosine/adenosine deaminase-related metal-dependent hydrolase